ncbi:lipid-A-disaccharide synthase [Shimia sp. FJ5]|uniref:lipid-A-disaccharide synthase n=1 Tax=Shimia sp. FJ5 TaxID=3079054 RepID=UPI00293DABC3|nr:lipid-A-disaccharide synthase [Shimia sp. FJ5]MDV4144096.1 lipid-A-disaccharide synthase [Shimia sp. FJ5]
MRVFLIAGEPSGDRLGEALMAGLKELCPEVQFEGVGGPLMQAEGMESLFPMDELSVMGIAEVLPKYRHLKRRMHQTAEAVIAAAPDVLITIDSPDFCLRVAKEVKAKSDLRIVHYVAPSVWAWRPKRAEKMARVVDQVLALLPFEPPYLEAVGLRCDFVGHPVVSEPVASDAEVAMFRDAQGIGDAPVLLALPGSRRSEVARLMPGFGAVAARLVEARPDLRVVLPAAGPVLEEVRHLAQDWAVAPVILDPTAQDAKEAKRAAFRAADVALAASGTVSLELAASATPMVIAYDMSWLSWQIMSRAALIDTVTLVNLVSETRVVPEFLGPAFHPDDIAPALLNVLDQPDLQQDAMSVTMDRLGLGAEAPGLRAARAVFDGLAG